MKLGFSDMIFAKSSFEEIMDFAASNGFDNVEVGCWPVKNKEEIAQFLAENSTIQESLLNCFLGVTHIDVSTLNEERILYIKECEMKVGVKISSLAYYSNPIEHDQNKQKMHLQHYKNLIDAAAKLDVNLVTTFIGRDQFKTVEENLKIAIEFWKPIIKYAEQNKVKIAIENCPMYFNENQWPGGQNLMISPSIWRDMFNAIDSEYFGLAYDPSHMILLQMDYIKPIYEFKHKIFYVHFKDAKIRKDKLDEVGIMAYPLQYLDFKIPGLGDINWSKFVSALTDIKYEGYSSIEIEDAAYEGSDEAIKKSLILSKRYLDQFVARIN